MLVFIKRNFSFKNKDVILPLYNTLVCQNPLRICHPVIVSPPCERKHTMKDSQPLTCSLLMSVAYQENWSSNSCFKILNGFTNVDTSTLFEIDDTLRTSYDVIKLKCRQVNTDYTNFFFANILTREGDKLPPSVVQGRAIDSFKNKLGRRLLQLNISLMT